MKRIFSIILILAMTLATLPALAEPTSEAEVENYVGKWMTSGAYGDLEGNITLYTRYILLAKNGTYLEYEAQDLDFFMGGIWELENGLCVTKEDDWPYVMTLQDGKMIDNYGGIYEYIDSPSMADEMLPFLGTWEATKLVLDAGEFKPEDMGYGGRLTLMEDNSCELTWTGSSGSETERLSGFVVEGFLVIMDPTAER